jgi:hypothetical protein
MDYKKLLHEAIEVENWTELLKLAQEVKAKTSDTGVFNLKKGYINLFRISNSRSGDYVYSNLEILGYKCFISSYNEDIKEYKELFTNQFMEENIVCIFTDNMALINNMPSLGIPIQRYTSRQRIKTGASRYSNKPGDKIYYIESDTEKYKFESFESVLGLLRQNQMDSILDD